MKIFPQSRLGKWSIGLTMFFFLLLMTFFSFMLFGFVTFDEGHWWDVTVAVAAPLEIIAFILSILTVSKAKERSVLIFLSIIIGLSVVLFILTHSLYIHD